MNTAGKLAAFAAVLAVGFGGAAAVGASVGPIDVGGDAGHNAHSADAAVTNDLPRGLAVAESGYRFDIDSTTIPADTATSLRFSILDDSGIAVTSFQQLHERPLHLIALSRNMIDYLHLHPTMDAEGHWTVDLPALTPGSYRVFADFQPSGANNLTLGADLTVPGNVDSVALPAAADLAESGDYTITMDGTPAVGDSELSFTVELDGQTVRTDPYLGASGHLVAIRTGDLAYLHVHPHEDETTSIVTFTGEFPTVGTYRLFFDFSHNGTVHTAAFTVTVPTGENTDTMNTHQEGH